MNGRYSTVEFLSRGRGNKEVHIYVCYCGNPGLLLYLFLLVIL